jgi:cytochrome b subunit of formate dehydrogenase
MVSRTVSRFAASFCESVCTPVQTAVQSGAAAAARWGRASLQWGLSTEERLLARERKVVRQPLVNRLIHWSIALSVGALFLSGFGQMPLYKRYMVSDLPGLAWTADFGATLLLHYVGAVVLVAAISFHLAYHGCRREMGCVPRRGDVRDSVRIVRAMLFGGKEPPSEKYLAEQRLAYAVIGGSLLLLIVTGFVKVAKNLQGTTMDPTIVALSTHLHNLGMVILLLALVGHLLAFVIPANRKLVPGMLHGKVDLAYVRHRHPLWHERLLARREVTVRYDSVDEGSREGAVRVTTQGDSR